MQQDNHASDDTSEGSAPAVITATRSSNPPDSRASSSAADAAHGHAPTTAQSYVVDVRPQDVLFGRGMVIMEHPGNADLRKMIRQNHKTYAESAVRGNKKRMCVRLVEIVRMRNGRFLRRLEQNEVPSPVAQSSQGREVFEEVTDDRILIQKMKQSFRYMIRANSGRGGQKGGDDGITTGPSSFASSVPTGGRVDEHTASDALIASTPSSSMSRLDIPAQRSQPLYQDHVNVMGNAIQALQPTPRQLSPPRALPAPSMPNFSTTAGQRVQLSSVTRLRRDPQATPAFEQQPTQQIQELHQLQHQWQPEPPRQHALNPMIERMSRIRSAPFEQGLTRQAGAGGIGTTHAALHFGTSMFASPSTRSSLSPFTNSGQRSSDRVSDTNTAATMSQDADAGNRVCASPAVAASVTNQESSVSATLGASDTASGNTTPPTTDSILSLQNAYNQLSETQLRMLSELTAHRQRLGQGQARSSANTEADRQDERQGGN